MGKIHNFNQIRFLPFKKRIGDVAVTNFYMDGDTPKPHQPHLDIPPFSFFEIVKYEPNPYYGKEEEYDFDGEYYRPKGYDNLYSIHKSCFTNPESSFMLGCWKNIDNDELIPNLELVNSRPFDLDEEEQPVFWELAKVGQEHITTELKRFVEEKE